MSLNPLRRRLGRGGLSLLVAASGTTLLLAGPAQTAAAGDGPVCADGTCTQTFAESGDTTAFVVPDGVTSIAATVAGAAGGDSLSGSQVLSAGGQGGTTTGSLTVKPGDHLRMLVGGKGGSADVSLFFSSGAGGYGGGGAGGSSFIFGGGGVGGGGGSFVFDDNDPDNPRLLLAAGGGGAPSAGHAGGLGGAVGADATAGTDGDAGSTGGGAGTLDDNGLGGVRGQSGGYAEPGGNGSSTTTSPTALSVGGNGGRSDSLPGFLNQSGGGGGGGYHSGGGGGATGGLVPNSASAGGGGGAGFAAASVTNAKGTAGDRAGDGQILLSWPDGPSVSFGSQAPTDAVVGDTYTVKATGTGSGDVSYSIDSATPDGACTIDGNKVSFVHAGTCVVKATQNDVSATQTIAIGQGTPVISFSLAEKGAVGSSVTLDASTDVKLPVVLTVSSASSPGACSIDATDGVRLNLTGEGTCTVVASTVATDDYMAAAPVSQTIAVDRVATKTTLSFDPAQAVYGQSVTVTATVSGATEGSVEFVVAGLDGGTTVDLVDGKASVTYPAPVSSGSPQYPNAGSYSASATFTPKDPSTYAGSSDEGSLVVGQAPQQITFDTLDATAAVGDHVDLNVSGGKSSNPVTVTVDPASEKVCSIQGTTLTFDAKGTCTVKAAQEGDADYSAAESVSQTVEVSQVATTVGVTFDVDKPVFGQDVTATATVTDGVPGQVTFFVDGDQVGDPVAVGSDGKASTALPGDLAAKGHEVKAVFTPTDEAKYEGSDNTVDLAVGKALSKTTLKVRTDEASVVVSAVKPGSGTPEGDVVFTVNGTPTTETLEHGKATLSTSVPSGATVSVEYGGDDSFLGSSDSTLRTDPTITAKVTSDTPESSFGWYRTPVTVTFTCAEGSAPLTNGCPEAVTLKKDGASQDVTRTITAEDGGIATASVTGINIDQTAPEVGTFSVKEGQRFFGSAPEASCIATDDLSGVVGCAATRTVKGDTVTYLASAIDRAGNVANEVVHATVYSYGVTDAPYANGVYTVKKGKSYDLIAAYPSKPRLYKIVAEGKKPTKKGPNRFRSTGDGTWAYTYYMGKSLKVGKTYNIGIKTDKMHVVTIHVV